MAFPKQFIARNVIGINDQTARVVEELFRNWNTPNILGTIEISKIQHKLKVSNKSSWNLEQLYLLFLCETPLCVTIL